MIEPALALIEFSSIATGIKAADAMVNLVDAEPTKADCTSSDERKHELARQKDSQRTPSEACGDISDARQQVTCQPRALRLSHPRLPSQASRG